MPENLDRENTFTLVQEDVRLGIGDTFRPRHSDEPDQPPFRRPPFDRDENAGTTVAVPWIYDCKHVGDPTRAETTPGFDQLFPTGRDLTINGVTVVELRDGEPVFRRYVDWIGLISQLGLTVSQRVLVGEEEYRAGLAQINDAPVDDE